MARGEMVRWLAQNRVERPEDVRRFEALGYRYAPDHSTETQLVFVKGGT